MVVILPLPPIPPALGGEERTIDNPHPRDIPLVHHSWVHGDVSWMGHDGWAGTVFLFNVWDDDLNIRVAGSG
jgi:hypothetical protein